MDWTSDPDDGTEEHERSLPDVGRTPLPALISPHRTPSPDDTVLDAAMHRIAREVAEGAEVHAAFGNIP
jgi:hypothetical protein